MQMFMYSYGCMEEASESLEHIYTSYNQIKEFKLSCIGRIASVKH